jgi:hypothetical protein
VQRRRRFGATLVALVAIIGLDGGTAGAARPVTPRVAAAVGEPRASGAAPGAAVHTPWGKDDAVGDARRPQGDLRRIVVENGRAQMTFMFRTVAAPFWDNLRTDRVVGMVFDMDWRGTSPAPDRTLLVSRDDNVWSVVVLRANGNFECTRYGGVRQLANHRFEVSVPVRSCLGGAHVLRVASGFLDDADDGPGEDASVDAAPNSRTYGPFISLPR